MSFIGYYNRRGIVLEALDRPPPGLARVAVDIAKEELAAIGLTLSSPKTIVWAKGPATIQP